MDLCQFTSASETQQEPLAILDLSTGPVWMTQASKEDFGITPCSTPLSLTGPSTRTATTTHTMRCLFWTAAKVGSVLTRLQIFVSISKYYQLPIHRSFSRLTIWQLSTSLSFRQWACSRPMSQITSYPRHTSSRDSNPM